MHVYFFICSFSWFPKFYSTWAKKEDWFRRHRHGWGSMPTMANPDDDCWPWDKINEDFCRGFSSSIYCRKLRMAGGAWLFSWATGKYQPGNCTVPKMIWSFANKNRAVTDGVDATGYVWFMCQTCAMRMRTKQEIWSCIRSIRDIQLSWFPEVQIVQYLGQYIQAV